MMDETEVLELVHACFEANLHPGAEGLQNDGAWFRSKTGMRTVISTDAFAEEIDFKKGWGTAYQAGARAIKQNLSDLAAMGARPTGFTWSLNLSATWLGETERLKAFLQGAADTCAAHELPLMGGDLGFQEQGLSCHVTVLGETDGTGLPHHKASPGESLWLSSPLGESHLGLRLLVEAHEKGLLPDEPSFHSWCAELPPQEQKWVQRHVKGHHELVWGHRLNGIASACIDISDGLAKDLNTLCMASGVGANLFWDPLVDHLRLGNEGLAEQAVLHGGEDFALLFCVPKALERALAALNQEGLHALKIGEISASAGQMMLNRHDCTKRLQPRGWDALAQ